MDNLKFSVPLRIKAKPRPKVTRNGVYYADADYAYWRALVLARAVAASGGKSFESGVPLRADITIYADHFEIEIDAIKDARVSLRPDIDNAIGAVFDALQGKRGENGLVENDRQFKEVHCRVAQK